MRSATLIPPRTPRLLAASVLCTFVCLSTGVRGQDVPAVPNVPQEEAQEYRALPPEEAAQQASAEEGPTRYLEVPGLVERNMKTYGWVAAGIGANNWGSPFNGTITFGDRNWQGMLNQLYLVNEKTLDTEDGGWDWGGRIDLLYGTDYIWTTAAGLDAFNYNSVNSYLVPRWNSSKYYGLAMPQLYAELGRGDLSAKFGHFYTPMGYEVVPAVGNFFYTINNTFQYGEPFTHTGMLGQWKASDQVTWFAGIVNGWDNWDSGTSLAVNNWYNYFNNNANFLGGATLKSADEKQTLSIFGLSGNVMNPWLVGPPPAGPLSAINANRSYLSTVYINQLSDKWTYVFQNDNGWQFGLQEGQYTPTAGQGNNGLAQWYGLVNYLFYKFDDELIGGMRFEYWRDNNAFRMVTQARNLNYSYWQPGQSFTGYQGNFWAITWGLNWIPTKNWRIRPELRYDWYTPDNAGGPLPYGGRGNGGDKYGQLYGGCDAIWQF